MAIVRAHDVISKPLKNDSTEHLHIELKYKN